MIFMCISMTEPLLEKVTLEGDFSVEHTKFQQTPFSESSLETNSDVEVSVQMFKMNYFACIFCPIGEKCNLLVHGSHLV